MKIKVNGKEVNIDTTSDAVTVSYLLEYLKIQSMVVVEKNGVILDRYTYDTEELIDGDVLEIVQFVGGG